MKRTAIISSGPTLLSSDGQNQFHVADEDTEAQAVKGTTGMQTWQLAPGP